MFPENVYEALYDIGINATFASLSKMSMLVATMMTELRYAVFIASCPNKRVAHLALHGKKRTRKKNRKRAYKLVEEAYHETL